MGTLFLYTVWSLVKTAIFSRFIFLCYFRQQNETTGHFCVENQFDYYVECHPADFGKQSIYPPFSSANQQSSWGCGNGEYLSFTSKSYVNASIEVTYEDWEHLMLRQSELCSLRHIMNCLSWEK